MLYLNQIAFFEYNVQYNKTYKCRIVTKNMIGDKITRKEVEAKLAGVGDYVKMDFLQRCLKK